MHRGFLAEHNIVLMAHGDHKRQALRILSTKCALAARVDACRSSPDGAEGKKILEQIETRLEKVQAPQQQRIVKALPKPEEKKSKKRGGKKFRNQRERIQMTEMRKAKNTIAFGPDA